jgi:hypothetical protein
MKMAEKHENLYWKILSIAVPNLNLQRKCISNEKLSCFEKFVAQE